MTPLSLVLMLLPLSPAFAVRDGRGVGTSPEECMCQVAKHFYLKRVKSDNQYGSIDAAAKRFCFWSSDRFQSIRPNDWESVPLDEENTRHGPKIIKLKSKAESGTLDLLRSALIDDLDKEKTTEFPACVATEARYYGATVWFSEWKKFPDMKSTLEAYVRFHRKELLQSLQHHCHEFQWVTDDDDYVEYENVEEYVLDEVKDQLKADATALIDIDEEMEGFKKWLSSPKPDVC